MWYQSGIRVTLDIRDVTRCKPVLKGWTTKLLNARESREVSAGGFGVGRLDAPRQCSNIHDHQASPIGAGPPQLNSSIPITSHNPQQATITKWQRCFQIFTNVACWDDYSGGFLWPVLETQGIFTKVVGNRGGRHQIGFVDARRREETELEVSLPPATPIYSLRPLPPTATGRLTAAGASRLCCRRGRVVGNETEKERETNATSRCFSCNDDATSTLRRNKVHRRSHPLLCTAPPRPLRTEERAPLDSTAGVLSALDGGEEAVKTLHHLERRSPLRHYSVLLCVGKTEGEGTIVELRLRHRTASTSTGGRREPPLLPPSRGEEIAGEGRWRFTSAACWNATPCRHHGCRGSFAGDRRSCELPPQPALATVLRSPEGEKDFSRDANEPLPAMPLLTAAALPANRLPSTCLEGNAIREEDLDRPPGPNRCLGGFATIMNCNAVVDPRITVVCGFPAAVDHQHLFGGAD
nr:uncharacterized protein LOC109155364 [Ipomoea batatas]